MKKTLAALTFLFALTMYAATPGAPSPFAITQTVSCPGDGGSVLVPLAAGQNAIAMRNFQADGGAATNINIGETAAIAANPYLGFPIKDSETLSIDVTALGAGRTVTPPTNIDGGVVVGLSSVVPSIYCNAGTAGGAKDLHLIKVR